MQEQKPGKSSISALVHAVPPTLGSSPTTKDLQYSLMCDMLSFQGWGGSWDNVRRSVLHFVYQCFVDLGYIASFVIEHIFIRILVHLHMRFAM